MRHLPGVTIIDSLGSSEGIMTRSEAKGAGDVQPARFAVNDRVAVLDEDTGEPVAPGSGQVGLVGVTGPIPLGYWGDDEKSRATFREYGGRRWSIPGDYATVEPDGSITLLGRGNACINTGGEKVYPEEVEVVLRDHPAVHDCVVVGVPDARFGEMVVAVVAPEPGATLDDDVTRRVRPPPPRRVQAAASLRRGRRPRPQCRREGESSLPSRSRSRARREGHVSNGRGDRPEDSEHARSRTARCCSTSVNDDEWATGHAPAATLMPLGELSERHTELPTDRRIVVICRSGARSSRATEALVDAGYDA